MVICWNWGLYLTFNKTSIDLIYNNILFSVSYSSDTVIMAQRLPGVLIFAEAWPQGQLIATSSKWKQS